METPQKTVIITGRDIKNNNFIEELENITFKQDDYILISSNNYSNLTVNLKNDEKYNFDSNEKMNNTRFKINNFIQNILFSYLIFLQIIFLFSSKNKNLSNVFVLYNLPSIGFLITSSILSPCAVNIPFMPEQTA